MTWNSFSSASSSGASEVSGNRSSKEWFDCGQRVLFDPIKKTIVSKSTLRKNPDAAYHGVWERTYIPAGNPLPKRTTRWLTLLPRFPDGSFGFSKLHSLLSTAEDPRITTPRLYVDYVGQGGSDPQPRNTQNSTMDRADLVQALWQAHGVQRTVVVTLDDSSLVLLELLRRQAAGTCTTKIEHAMIVNGSLFADGHSFPRLSRWGNLGAGLAPRAALKAILHPLFSKSYRSFNTTIMKQEVREMIRVMRNHGGVAVVERSAEVYAEHLQEYPDRWDLEQIMEQMKDTGITLHIVGSDEHRSEHEQIKLAQERLGKKFSEQQIKIEQIAAGHMVTFERPLELTKMIQQLANKSSNLTVDETPAIQHSYNTSQSLLSSTRMAPTLA